MTSLDPHDWKAFRQTAHHALDGIITMLEHVRDQAVWKALPDESQSVFERQMRRFPRPLDEVISDVMRHVAPFGTGNTHPRFMGWVHGAGTPVGIVAEMISAGLNLNCGGRYHVGLVVERQIASWLADLIKYPPTATGLFVTGSSIANFIAIYIALVARLGPDYRSHGHRKVAKKMVAYTSAHGHGCIGRGLEMAGLGSNQLRRIPVDAAGRISLPLLNEAITRDRDNGFDPFLVVATAGSVETGAVDQLDELGAIAAHERLWFHVDGAIGALALLSDKLRPLFRGIEESQSIALDFHKWGHVPYDAGFLMVRNSAANLAAFSNSQSYLQRGERGLASGDVWPCDLGPDLSRGFRALKTWMTFETLGSDAIAKCIDENCSLAAYMARRIEADPLLELKAPVALNIVCFGIRTTKDASAINREIVMNLHEQGIAAPSWTQLGGETVIRCAIFNHRTTRDDVDTVLDAISRLVRHYSSEQEASQ